jgi:hypothetical protein
MAHAIAIAKRYARAIAMAYAIAIAKRYARAIAMAHAIAIASISTNAALGRAAAWKVDRAGYGAAKREA